MIFCYFHSGKTEEATSKVCMDSKVLYVGGLEGFKNLRDLPIF